MDVPLSDTQSEIISNIAEKEGFADFEVETEPGSSKGDNYLGIITKVTVNNHKQKLDLIMKSASKSEELRKKIPIRKAFLREMYMYETIFPAFETFQLEQDLQSDLISHAKIYGSCRKDPNECLFLENLKENGYQLWNRKEPMNPDHVALVFREYGKFHAVSLAMREKMPELFEELTKNLDNIFQSSVSKRGEDVKLMSASINQGLKTVKGNQIATDALERFYNIFEQFFFEDLKSKEDNLVLLHGDCWCNNLLFKYEDPQSQKPTKVCLIDWQLSTVGSPARDLAYFLFTCAPKSIIANYKKYLKIYHDTVCYNLKKYGIDGEALFPFTLVEQHWKKYAKFGLYLALTLVKFMLSESDEVPVLAEIADSGKDISEELAYESVNDEKYKQRVVDMVTVAAENHWL